MTKKELNALSGIVYGGLKSADRLSLKIAEEKDDVKREALYQKSLERRAMCLEIVDRFPKVKDFIFQTVDKDDKIRELI